jgi:hypothetical protein
MILDLTPTRQIASFRGQGSGNRDRPVARTLTQAFNSAIPQPETGLLEELEAMRAPIASHSDEKKIRAMRNRVYTMEFVKEVPLRIMYVGVRFGAIIVQNFHSHTRKLAYQGDYFDNDLEEDLPSDNQTADQMCINPPRRGSTRCKKETRGMTKNAENRVLLQRVRRAEGKKLSKLKRGR